MWWPRDTLDAAALVAGPLGTVLLALVLAQLPERLVEIRLHLDLRAATLLALSLALFALTRPATRRCEPLGSHNKPATGLEEPAQKPVRPTQAEEELAVEAPKAHQEPAGPLTVSPAAAPALPRDVCQALVFHELPEELIRELVAWSPSAEDPQVPTWEAKFRRECPVCEDVMIRPRRMSCQHHACGACLERLRLGGCTLCPQCSAAVDLQDLQAAGTELLHTVGALLCRCRACGQWEGRFDEMEAHLVFCPAAQSLVSLRSYRLVLENERRQKLVAQNSEVDKLFANMAAASPVLAHQIPGHVFDQVEGRWSTPPFFACGRLWSVATEPMPGAALGGFGFYVLPHRHDDRMRCRFVFAKKPGQGFKERLVHDWTADLAGMPWGPTVLKEELAEYRQRDGSVLLMLHVEGLLVDSDNHAAAGEDAAGLSKSGGNDYAATPNGPVVSESARFFGREDSLPLTARGGPGTPGSRAMYSARRHTVDSLPLTARDGFVTARDAPSTPGGFPLSARRQDSLPLAAQDSPGTPSGQLSLSARRQDSLPSARGDHAGTPSGRPLLSARRQASLSAFREPQ